jgi:signal transduction histidine kinase
MGSGGDSGALEAELSELRTLEARQRALLSVLPDLMFRLHRDGTYLEFAGDLSRLATPAEALLGSNSHDILPGQVAAALMECAAQALASGHEERVEYELKTLAGPVRDFEARVIPSGEHEVLAIVRDVTEQRSAERELRESRSRIARAADQERRRLERNLHDGAQQRFVSASLRLRLAARALESDPSEAREPLAIAQAELTAGMAEIRELVRGLRPALLAKQGLGAAVASLAERAAVPVEIERMPADRLAEESEEAAYYVIAEALTNATKHARATLIRVSAVTAESGELLVTVADDGVGGASAAPNGGLEGLGDRVAALGGRLRLESEPGQGTTLTASIPA